MSRRKTIIELQSKPENRAVRRIVEKPKPVEFAPINPPNLKTRRGASTVEGETTGDKNARAVKSDESSKTASKKSSSAAQTEETVRARRSVKAGESNSRTSIGKSAIRKGEIESVESTSSLPVQQRASVQGERLRIFQTSTPVTRTLTRFQKAAIVVRGENGKQLVELLWRDQMNEKTRDIWDFLWKKFVQAAEFDTSGVSIRKRDILEGSGVKSDRTFISAIYTLEDMGLIEVKRLSGNKEGNVYILTDEGREEIAGYRNLSA